MSWLPYWVLRKRSNLYSVVVGEWRGYLRWWPIDEIDSAEADYDNGILEWGAEVGGTTVADGKGSKPHAVEYLWLMYEDERLDLKV